MCPISSSTGVRRFLHFQFPKRAYLQAMILVLVSERTLKQRVFVLCVSVMAILQSGFVYADGANTVKDGIYEGYGHEVGSSTPVWFHDFDRATGRMGSGATVPFFRIKFSSQIEGDKAVLYIREVWVASGFVLRVKNGSSQYQRTFVHEATHAAQHLRGLRTLIGNVASDLKGQGFLYELKGDRIKVLDRYETHDKNKVEAYKIAKYIHGLFYYYVLTANKTWRSQLAKDTSARNSSAWQSAVEDGQRSKSELEAYYAQYSFPRDGSPTFKRDWGVWSRKGTPADREVNGNPGDRNLTENKSRWPGRWEFETDVVSPDEGQRTGGQLLEEPRSERPKKKYGGMDETRKNGSVNQPGATPGQSGGAGTSADSNEKSELKAGGYKFNPVSIPKIPMSGSVCTQGEKDKLILFSEQAVKTAKANFDSAKAAVKSMRKLPKSSENKVQIRAMEAEKDANFKKYKKAKAALKEAQSLKVGDCPENEPAHRIGDDTSRRGSSDSGNTDASTPRYRYDYGDPNDKLEPRVRYRYPSATDDGTRSGSDRESRRTSVPDDEGDYEERYRVRPGRIDHGGGMTTVPPPSDPSLLDGDDLKEPIESVIPELGGPLSGSDTSTPTGSDSSSEETDPGSGATGVEAPLQPAFNIILTGAISFQHEVGGSSCPQSAGKVSVELSNGNSLLLSNISIEGDLASRLDLSITGNVINGFFNCSSAENGEFTGTITGTATDQTNKASKSFSLSASGYVGD